MLNSINTFKMTLNSSLEDDFGLLENFYCFDLE